MKSTLWLIFVGLPVALVTVVFSIYNYESIPINLWPLEHTESLPVFVVVLAALVVGFLLGAMVMWLSSAPLRTRARQARYQRDELERELTYVKRQQSKSAETTTGGAPYGTGGVAVADQRSLPAT